ncbi:MAG: heavy-metal-associated domain-containing protein [Thiotrichales bacterium]|nr:heavy-metal-associated domain-containing protein [Thiotrichales bacterium]
MTHTNRFEITVENIKCGGCANQIKNKLMENPLIQHVMVDIEAGLVKIEADLAEKSVIVERLAQLGYPEVGSLAGLKSVGAKAKSFVSCAVGRMTDDAEQNDKGKGESS